MRTWDGFCTRGIIGIKKGDSYEYIYSNFDNDLAYMGVILATHYNTLDKAEKLVALGAVYSVGPHLESKCTNMQEWVQLSNKERSVIAYFRDQHLTGVDTNWDEAKPRISTNIKKVCDNHYTYVFNAGKGSWDVAMCDTYYNPNGPIFYDLVSLLQSKTLQRQFMSGE